MCAELVEDGQCAGRHVVHTRLEQPARGQLWRQIPSSTEEFEQVIVDRDDPLVLPVPIRVVVGRPVEILRISQEQAGTTECMGDHGCPRPVHARDAYVCHDWARISKRSSYEPGTEP